MLKFTERNAPKLFAAYIFARGKGMAALALRQFLRREEGDSTMNIPCECSECGHRHSAPDIFKLSPGSKIVIGRSSVKCPKCGGRSFMQDGEYVADEGGNVVRIGGREQA